MTTAMNDPFAQPSSLVSTKDPEGDNAAYSFDGKPDRWKRYRLPDPETGAPGGYTRATTFAKSTSDTYALSMWGQRMVVEGLIKQEDLYVAACALDFSDKEAVNAMAEKAKNAAGAKTGANLGTALHAFSESLDRQEEVSIPAKFKPHMAAWTTLLKRYNMEVVEIERRVLHTGLDNGGVAGTLDRIVRFTKDTEVSFKQGRKTVSHVFKKGSMAILDLKTGRDLSYGWMEIAVQLVVYSDAPLMFIQPDGPGTEWEYRAMPEEIDKEIALVVHIPAQEDGKTVQATLYAVDLSFGREVAELCGLVRAARKRKNVAVALDVVEELAVAGEVLVVPSERVGDEPLALPGQAMQVREPTRLERAANAVTEEELSGIWWEAIRAREETPELAAAIRSRKAAILADSAAG